VLLSAQHMTRNNTLRVEFRIISGQTTTLQTFPFSFVLQNKLPNGLQLTWKTQ